MEHRSEAWKTFRLLAIIAAFIAIAWLGVRAVEGFTRGTSSGIERSLDKVLAALTHSNTRVVEGRAEIISQNDIRELALVELRMSATRSFENETYVLKYLPAGTKKLVARGNYRITAGYRLQDGVSLRMENGRTVAHFPPADILGVELIDFEVLSEKDGWANTITPEDRSTLLRELRQQMRVEAKKSGLLDLVDSTLKTRLRDLLGVENVEIERATSSPLQDVPAQEPP
ncbi:hypothetical protein HNR46_001629 [Haloferula luteola]|uniref:DUF4230 domain-containing protein n=1 Tax=Haloferula luteola TaxID=595692 RepID=A0A840V1V3_9BACT|nr:DUF4230 domain-containing protein [Haloferula luteola]MBB5351393.1 hypothetical protein [Haloferula luteola]